MSKQHFNLRAFNLRTINLGAISGSLWTKGIIALLSSFAFAPLAVISPMDKAIASEKSSSAISRIFDARGELVGVATFLQTNMGVQVSLQVRNLAKGEHMVHIHEIGKCDAPDFSTSGRHFDPHGSHTDGKRSPHMHHKHETPKDSQGAHIPAGDLPNMMVMANGNGNLVAMLPNLTLGMGDTSLLKQGGTSILIHAGANGKSTIPNVDYKTRIACGVIQAE